MALINCPECGKEISDKAASCPNCGATVKKKFCQHCGEAIDNDCVVCPKCGKQVGEIVNNDKNIIINNNNNASSSSALASNNMLAGNIISSKSRLVALLLCFFLGWLGVHRFYVGKIGTGILMVLLMPTGIGEVWWLIDFIFIALGVFSDKNGFKIKNW